MIWFILGVCIMFDASFHVCGLTTDSIGVKASNICAGVISVPAVFCRWLVVLCIKVRIMFCCSGCVFM